RNIILTVWIEAIATDGPNDATGNRIQGNYIGTDLTGTAALQSTSFYTGIRIESADFNLVGGIEPGAGNVIQGELDIFGGNSNVVQGNLIGTDATGTKSLSGVVAINGLQDFTEVISGIHNVIGGTTPAARNIIAGGVDRAIGGFANRGGV